LGAAAKRVAAAGAGVRYKKIGKGLQVLVHNGHWSYFLPSKGTKTFADAPVGI
jgi:hypothetical protein